MNRKGILSNDANVVEVALNTEHSTKGAHEITVINRIYQQQFQLYVELMERGMALLDTGSHDSLQEADQFANTLVGRQLLKVVFREEITLRSTWLIDARLEAHPHQVGKIDYGCNLKSLLTGNVIAR